MKIRIYAPFFPDPPHEGAFLVIAEQTRFLLSQGHSVELVYWKGNDPEKRLLQEHFPHLQVRRIETENETPTNVAGLIRLFRSLFSGIASGETFHYPPRLSPLNTELDITVDYEIFHFSFAYPWLRNRQKKQNRKTAIYFHNLESDLYSQRAQTRRSPLFLPLVALEKYNASLLLRHEAEITRLADELWFISPSDLARFKELHPETQSRATLRFVPPVFSEPRIRELRRLQSSATADRVILGFVGGLHFQPNQMSVRWILDRLAPLLEKGGFKGEIWIAGRSAPRSLINAGKKFPFVKFLGYLPDLNHFWGSLSYSLIPHISGSGVRTKLMESLALGIPVLANSAAAAGLSPELSGDPLLFNSDRPEAWANRILAEQTPLQRRNSNATDVFSPSLFGKGIYDFILERS